MAVLRHRVFFNIADLNAAIAELLERVNARALRKVKKSRREKFEPLDTPNAKTLPARPYEYAEWKMARVSLNYHVELERHNYSVPCRLLHEKLEARLTATMVEVFYKHERVACHARSFVVHGYTTLKEHMPPEHQKHLDDFQEVLALRHGPLRRRSHGHHEPVPAQRLARGDRRPDATRRWPTRSATG